MISTFALTEVKINSVSFSGGTNFTSNYFMLENREVKTNLVQTLEFDVQLYEML